MKADVFKTEKLMHNTGNNVFAAVCLHTCKTLFPVNTAADSVTDGKIGFIGGNMIYHAVNFFNVQNCGIPNKTRVALLTASLREKACFVKYGAVFSVFFFNRNNIGIVLAHFAVFTVQFFGHLYHRKAFRKFIGRIVPESFCRDFDKVFTFTQVFKCKGIFLRHIIEIIT